MSALNKRIILSPEQLHKLLGRESLRTSEYDASRRAVLQSANQAAPAIGPAQAYAVYQSAQQRHLQQASRERAEPLEMLVVDPTSSVGTATPNATTVEQKDLKTDKRKKKRKVKTVRAQRPVVVASPLLTRAARRKLNKPLRSNILSGQGAGLWLPYGTL